MNKDKPTTKECKECSKCPVCHIAHHKMGQAGDFDGEEIVIKLGTHYQLLKDQRESIVEKLKGKKKEILDLSKYNNVNANEVLFNEKNREHNQTLDQAIQSIENE